MTSQTDPLSLANLIAWLETQPADGEFDPTECGACLLAQWVRSIDPTARPADGRSSWHYDVLGATHDLEKFKPIAIAAGPDTFGAALARARTRARAV